METLIGLDAILRLPTRCECGFRVACGNLYQHALSCREVSSAFKSRAKLARANFDLNPADADAVLVGLVDRLSSGRIR
ncbi:MAG TPA: hypothetical protein VFW94_06985 [Candidatus Acidoferrales bacterium]|nr:hypothetical protein [Candidatus Acidoferrales bacterium]